MITALSPGLSWLIFGGWLLSVVLIGAFFMGAARGTREYEERLDGAVPSWANPEEAHIRIIRGPYDAETRGDFE
jgi:hypothetical protein